MDYLERILQRLVDDGKGEGFMARSLRDQIAAQTGGQTAQNLYITGMVKRNLDQKPQGE